MTAIELLKSTTEYEVLESFRNKVAKLEEKENQSYSEKEVINILVEFSTELKSISKITEWFEQFKKK